MEEEISLDFLFRIRYAGIVTATEYPQLFKISRVTGATYIEGKGVCVISKNGHTTWFKKEYLDIMKETYPMAKWHLSAPLSNGLCLLCHPIDDEKFIVLCGLRSG